ncbi:tripartite tricarboxylate transporter substrate binding protein [Ureibacillus acetophenoni]|uniref:Tripartite-type tricarboxylate transporter receptor subunit TctC n=1 Tax=Ureibacillus acetophenoni TaxID=614649 RepID=A0A285UHS8_9BACL|nr:tripartite tricarboxylate transporter substrate binding protein [Ureibacillus acetophenoni]SOC41419.1 tripartite-type tricarboxylate transporter receptor subunit TctC [Ureibacillus acetophenoni]
MKKRGFLLILGLVLLLSACGTTKNSSGGSAYPNKHIEIVAPASPGGGWDLTARSVQKILKDNELVQNNINVINKPGGGGEVGWNYLNTKDSHYLAVNSSLLLTNNLLGQSKLTHQDFTPLATLATEWQAIAVSVDSPYQNINELFEQIKKDPTSVKIGVGPGLGNDDHLSFVQATGMKDIQAKDLNFLVYDGGGGDVVTALLGKHVDAVTTSLSEVKEHHLAGKVKILAVSSDERLEELEDVPTLQEEGLDMVFPHWRGIMGPPNMTEEEIQYWDEKLSKMVESEEWKQLLENNDWDSFYQTSEETRLFMAEQEKLYKELIDQSGLVQ